MAACQYSSGVKKRLARITKAGDAHLRTFLIMDARAPLASAAGRSERIGRWGAGAAGAARRHARGGGGRGGHVFVRRGRRGDRIKCLYWSGDGLFQWAKRLDALSNGRTRGAVTQLRWLERACRRCRLQKNELPFVLPLRCLRMQTLLHDELDHRPDARVAEARPKQSLHDTVIDFREKR